MMMVWVWGGGYGCNNGGCDVGGVGDGASYGV